MRRDQVTELHYIVPIANLSSIFALGILSHNKMRKLRLEYQSVAKQEIQDRRVKVVVPGGRKLHDHVNLYFDARNPMMYLRRTQHASLCVLIVSTAVLDLPKVIVTDCNASSGYARFAPAPEGLSIVDYDLTFAEYWTHTDPIEFHRRRLARCAEVLVPDRVDQSYILGVYISCPESNNVVTDALVEAASHMPISVNAHLFFR